jgi:DNA primase
MKFNMIEVYQRYFKYQLVSPPFERWRNYLRSVRKINFETAQRFELGAAGSPLPGEFYTFQDTVTISNRNQHGELVGLFGRKLEDVDSKYAINPGYRKYSTIFGLWQAKESIIQAGYAIITEGIFDVLSLHQLEFTNTVASPGKDWFPQQVALLRRYTDTIILLFDNDSIGRRFGSKCRDKFFEAGFYVDEIKLKTVKDIDELIRKDSVAAKQFLLRELSRKNNKEE